MEMKGVWVYRIREDNGNTRVKNLYSERDVSLHSVLTDILDFVGYVSRMKKFDHERVFNELPK